MRPKRKSCLFFHTQVDMRRTYTYTLQKNKRVSKKRETGRKQTWVGDCRSVELREMKGSSILELYIVLGKQTKTITCAALFSTHRYGFRRTCIYLSCIVALVEFHFATQREYSEKRRKLYVQRETWVIHTDTQGRHR